MEILLVCVGLILPFLFSYLIWNHPQTWVNLCGKDRDPSKMMAMLTYLLKVVQFVSLYSVSTFSWPPPFFFFWPLFLIGQFLRIRASQLLGESGTYYGVRFGKNIPWVTDFPFGTVKDPQYLGNIMILLACMAWVPIWCILICVHGYLFMILFESEEDPATRARPMEQWPGKAAADVAVHEDPKSMNHRADIEALLPKLCHPDYYTKPSIQELAAKELVGPNSHHIVDGFLIGRHNYGSIKFYGYTNLTGLDLNSVIQINHREVVVYKDQTKKPTQGLEFNRPAEVTLLNVKCVDKKTGRHLTQGLRVDKYKKMLKKKTEDQGAKFVSYDPAKGEWKFRVNYASRYCLQEEEENILT